MAISEVAMEVLYIVGILKFLCVKLRYPIELTADNIGAVYLAKNATTGNRSNILTQDIILCKNVLRTEL